MRTCLNVWTGAVCAALMTAAAWAADEDPAQERWAVSLNSHRIDTRAARAAVPEALAASADDSPELWPSITSGCRPRRRSNACMA